MGLEIRREHFDEEDYQRFSDKLEACVRALRTVSARPLFGAQPASVGAELELNLVGDDERPKNVNRAVLADVLDRHHMLVLGSVEHDDTLGRAARDADALDRAADQLAPVGHQHDLVTVLDRE